MAGWGEFEAAVPELAAEVRESFEARVHHTLATVRADGSPRISGTELIFALDQLWMGSMWRSPKARDLRRDARFAVHSGSEDPPQWAGDAKVAGFVEEVTDPGAIAQVMATQGDRPSPARFHLFRLDINEAIALRLSDPPDYLIATRWREGEGITVSKLTA